MADVNGDENKEETREMAPGGLSLGHSSISPQPALCARQSPLGVLLPPLSGVSLAQDDLTLSLSLKSLGICWQSTLKIPRKSQDTWACIFFVNAARNGTVPSWRDPQSLETLRSSVTWVHIQQRTRMFTGGGMTACHHTCDRWPNRMPL